MVVEGTVYVGRDAAVSLAASREMLEVDSSVTEEQYRTTNLVGRNVKTICVDPRPCASFSSKFATALINAADNYTALPLTFDMSVRANGDFIGCEPHTRRGMARRRVLRVARVHRVREALVAVPRGPVVGAPPRSSESHGR
jgi:hypothetical protein